MHNRTIAIRTTGALAAFFLLTACTPAESPEIAPTATATLGNGLYSINMGANQELLCSLFDDPSHPSERDVVARCAANFPVTWKLIDDNHEQAAHLEISQNGAGELSITAHKDPLMTVMIVPTPITESTVVNRLYIEPSTNEVRFFSTNSASPEIAESPVLITPDSYEVLLESTAKVGHI